MPIELIQGSDTLNVGRIKINNFYSGQTNIWSSSNGSDSIIANNYTNNLASGIKSTVLGGRNNQSITNYGTVVNGSGNTASSTYSFVGNGRGNTASGTYSFAGNGTGNTVGTSSTVINGQSNRATGTRAFIGTGLKNSATTSYSVVISGKNNMSTASSSFIGTGNGNTATTAYATVVNGKLNQASGKYSFIGAGMGNSATTKYSVVGGGRYNLSAGDYSFVGGGGGFYAYSATKRSNKVYGNYSFIGAGQSNTIRVAASNSSIVGGFGSTVTAGSSSFIGGGNSHTMSGSLAFIGAGNGNIIAAGGSNASIVGGLGNYIQQKYGFIGGGFHNTTSGSYACVPGGRGNEAAHTSSVAMGGGSKTRTQFDVVIGATSTNSPNVNNNTITFSGSTGDIAIVGAYRTGWADFAEHFEWSDGNINGDDRKGYFASLIDGKIQIGNTNVIGVVSANPAILGDSPSHWPGMYQKDIWGTELRETYKVYTFTESRYFKKIYENENGEIFSEYPNPSHKNGIKYEGKIPSHADVEMETYKKMNPDYNPDLEYFPKTQRREYAPIGLIGKIYVRTSEEITAKFIDAKSDGTAINGTTYNVLKTIKPFDGDYGIVQILFK